MIKESQKFSGFSGIDQAMDYYNKIKTSTELQEIHRKDCKLSYDASGDEIMNMTVKTDHGIYNLHPDALNQYLIRTCGKAAPKAFTLFSSVKGDEHAKWFQDGVDLVNKITESSKGDLRLHVLDGQILGVTSLKHVKLYDADLLDLVLKSVEGYAGFRSSWSPNMTVFDLDLQAFKDPSGLDWSFSIRFENNEFGRNAFQASVMGVRQVCTNGAIISTDLMRAHRVIHVRHLTVELIQETVNKSIKSLDEVSEVIKKSFSTYIKDFPAVWRMLRKKFKVRKDDRPKITKFIDEEERPDTTYAFGSGLSAFANTMSTIDRYYALQEAAGMIYAYSK